MIDIKYMSKNERENLLNGAEVLFRHDDTIPYKDYVMLFKINKIAFRRGYIDDDIMFVVKFIQRILLDCDSVRKFTKEETDE